METKLSQLKDMTRRGEWGRAIKFAAKFPRLGKHRAPILDAKEALLRPAFLLQIGKDPAALIISGKSALVEKYKL